MRIIKKRKNKLDEHAQLEAARIIAADPLHYTGVIQEWAKLFLQKHEIAANIPDLNPAKVPYSRH